MEPILIIHPGLHVGTPSVYRALSQVGYPLPEPCPSLAAGAAPPWKNDLTGAAIWVCPSLAEVRAALVESGGEPLLCGSGSAWAAKYPATAERDAAMAKLRAAHSAWSFWAV